MAIQQELKPQVATPVEEDVDELYEEEPRRGAWGAIASVVLAVALVFVGYQWHEAAGRAESLAGHVNALRADGETQRLRAEEAQRAADSLQQRVVALTAEKETLAERVTALERAGQRATAAAAPSRDVARARATPVAAKKTR